MLEEMPLGPSCGHGLSTVSLSGVQSSSTTLTTSSDHSTSALQLIGSSNLLNEDNASNSAEMESGILPFMETEEGGQVIFRGIVDQNGAVILDNCYTASQFAALMNSVTVEQSVSENLTIVNQSTQRDSTNIESVIRTGKSLPLTSSHQNQRMYTPIQSYTNGTSFQPREIRPCTDLQPNTNSNPDQTKQLRTFQRDIEKSTTLNSSSRVLELQTCVNTDTNISSSRVAETSSLISVLSTPTSITASKTDSSNSRLASENVPSLVPVDAQQSQVLPQQPHPSTFVEVEPPIGKGPYRCQECGKVFPKWPQFKRHKAEHLDEKSHRCSLCSVTFNFESNLKLHQMIHDAEINGCLECQVCPAKFTRLASLKSHVRVHEKEENLVCPECGDEFATKARLDTHIEDHKTTKSLLYRCRLCGKSFTQAALLKDHAKEHTAVRNQLKILSPRRRKPAQPKSSRDPSSAISKSRERVEKKKTLLCPICAKRFQKPSQLARHVRIHTGEKPYSCKDCGRSFNQKGTLESHILSMHDKLKPYICHLCNCQFSQRGNLKAHVLKVHVPPGDDERVFKCQECSCVYRRLATLNTHISKSHSKTSQAATLVDGCSENAEPLMSSKNCEDLMQLKNSVPEADIQESVSQKGDISATQTLVKANQVSTPNNILLFPKNVSTDKNSSETGQSSSKEETISQITEVKLAHETQSGKAITCVVNVKKVGLEKWHLCSSCSKSFRKPSDLIRHIRIHTLERPFKCHVCMKCFAVKSTLNTHMKTHSLQKDCECRVCHKRFSVMTSLRAHERLHTGAKPFNCLQCGKGFRTSSQRRMHSKIHSRNAQEPTGKRKLLRIGDTEPKIDLPDPLKITSEGLVPVPNRTSLSIIKPNTVQDCKIRPYRCSQCPSAFKKSSHLKQHNLSHSKERPYKCFQCYRSFISSGVLKNHIKTHEGVRAYKCHICQLSFTTNGSLTRHMVTHTDVRPFVCPYCHKTFKTSVSCRKHIKTHKSEFVAFRTNVDDLPSSVVANSSVTNIGEDIQGQAARIVNDHRQNFPSGYQGNEDIYTENEEDNFDHSFGIGDASSNVNLRLSHHDEIGISVTDNNALLASMPQNNSNGMDDCIMQQQIQDITELIAESGRLSTSGGEVTLQYSMRTASQIEEVAHQISLAEGHHFDGSIFNLQEGDSIELPAQSSSLLPQHSQEDPLHTTQNSMSRSTYIQAMVSNMKFDMPMETSNFIPTEDSQPSKLDNTVQHQQTEASLKDNRIQELILSSKPISEQIFNEMTVRPITDSGFLCPTDDAQPYNDGKIIETDKTKVNKCTHCGRGFRKRSDLLRHVRIHTGEKPFRCHICGKAFRVKSTREAHIRTHEGGKTVACHVCENLFSTKSSLRVHIRLHTGAKPYKCPHCDRWFRTSGHRKAHSLSHFKIPKDSGKLPPVETIKDKGLTSQSSMGGNNYNTATNSLSDPVQIIGSLQLTMDGSAVQNIQITGLDLNNLQLSEDFLQSLGNVIFMTPNQLGITSNDLSGSNMIGITLPSEDVNQQNQLMSSQNHQDPSLSHLINQTASVLTGKDVNVGNTVTNMPPYNQRLMHNPDSSSISIGDLDSLTVPSEHTLMCGFNSLSSSAVSGTPLLSSETEAKPVGKNNSTSSQSSKECSTCGKVFAKPSLLKRHMLLHTGAKPYQCGICGCTFNQKNSLSVHMYTHSNERPFVCSLCPFKTVVKAALKKHCSRAHPNLNVDNVILSAQPVPNTSTIVEDKQPIALNIVEST